MPVSNSQFYGLGKGAAQVIDTTSGAQQQFGQILARQQQQRQLELKQLTDQQAQLKPGALRNSEELNDFLNYQNDWKNKSIAAINEKDPYKKSLAHSEADMAYQKAQNFVARSQQEQAQIKPLMADLSNPLKAYQYAPGSVQKVIDNNNISVDNPKFVKNIGTTLQAAPDNDYADKIIKGINDKLINGATQTYQWDKPIKDPSGKMLQPWTLGQSIDPMAENGLAHQIANRASVINGVPVDPKFLNAFHARNADLFANVQNEDDLHMATNLAAAREAQQGELYRKVGHGLDKPGETDADKEAMHAANRSYDLRHLFPNQTIGGQFTPAQTLVTNMQKGVPGSGEKLLSLTPQGQYGSQKPVIGMDANGNHIFNFPAQQDQKAIAENAALKAKFAKEYPGDAYDPQATGYSKLKPENIKEAKIYTLNPNSPDYAAQAAKMANEQNINLTKLNQIESVKGGRGQIPQAQSKATTHPPDKTPVTPTGTVLYSLNGTSYNIPANLEKKFLKENPKAKKGQ